MFKIKTLFFIYFLLSITHAHAGMINTTWQSVKIIGGTAMIMQGMLAGKSRIQHNRAQLKSFEKIIEYTSDSIGMAVLGSIAVSDGIKGLLEEKYSTSYKIFKLWTKIKKYFSRSN